MGRRHLDEGTRAGGAVASAAVHVSDTLLARIDELTRELEDARASETKFRLIAEQATDIISRHAPDGTCTYVSPAVTAVLGYAPAELVGHTLLHNIHADDLPGFIAVVDDLRAGGEASPVRFRILSKRTGEYVWFETKLRAIRDNDGDLEGFHAIARDITWRKRGEDALRESEARFRLLAEDASDIISRTTPDGRIIYVSPSCSTVLGYSPEELIGRPAQELIEPDDFPEAAAARAALIAGGENPPVVHRLRHKDGHPVWAETTRHTIRDAATDEVVEIHAVSRDVTARIRAEEQAHQLAEMKSDFVALVSHELRAPLTNMVGSIELLEHEASSVPDSARRTLAVLAGQTERLRQLVETILDLSRLDAGQLPLTLGPVPVDIAIARAVETLPPSAATSVTTEIERGLAFAWADETYLTQVIANLLSNAVKYGAPPITVRASSAWPDILIEVTDAGGGVHASELERLFDPFFRSGYGTSPQSGYGLGLYFARRLLAAQRGSITVDSPVHDDPGAPGARFTITIPVAHGGP